MSLVNKFIKFSLFQGIFQLCLLAINRAKFLFDFLRLLNFREVLVGKLEREWMIISFLLFTILFYIATAVTVLVDLDWMEHIGLSN